MKNYNCKKHKGKPILVTGGAGFMGSNLCETLLKIGAKIICLDNFSTWKIENVSHLLENPFFEHIEGDIRKLDTCKKLVKKS